VVGRKSKGIELMKTQYRLGDVVKAKFHCASGEFSGTARIVDEVYGIRWDEKRREMVKSDKLVSARPPAFEVLSDDRGNLPTGARIWGSWSDVTGLADFDGAEEV
jgi:hypothetical protein